MPTLEPARGGNLIKTTGRKLAGPNHVPPSEFNHPYYTHTHTHTHTQRYAYTKIVHTTVCSFSVSNGAPVKEGERKRTM